MNPETAVENLIAAGLVVREKRLGKEAVPVSLESATSVLLDEYENQRVELFAADVWRFLLSAIDAARVACFRSDCSALRRIQRHLSRMRGRVTVSDVDERHLSEMRRALSVFRTLRPLLWPVTNRVYFERLVLAGLFARFGYRVNWVLAVSADPLRVHMWLQFRDVVIDDAMGFTSTFQPIAKF